MKCLALTSSTTHASIALGEASGSGSKSSEEFFGERFHQVPRGHTEFMNSALQELLIESKWTLTDIDLIAVDQGPGSFTGIRVAVSIARTLCYSLKKPCFVTNALDLLATAQPRPRVIGLNAFKNLIFAKIFTPDGVAHGPRVLSTSDLELWIKELIPEGPVPFQGDGFTVYERDWSAEFKSRVQRENVEMDFPRASTLVRLGLQSHPNDWLNDWKLITPLYLRASAAEENLRKL